MERSKSTLTHYQRIIFVSLFLGYASYAYNRKCVSLALPALIREIGLSKNDAGLIASSQNLAYAISKFAGGVLSDRISSRALFSSGLLLSGVVTLAFSSYDTAFPFAVLWFGNGLAQGAGWPACAKLLKHWFPPETLGTWWSLVSASANISGALAPFLAAYLISNYGWQISVAVAGAATIFMGMLAYPAIKDTPEDIGFKSFGSGTKKTDRKNAGSETVMDLLKSPFIWLIAFCYMTVSCAKTSVVDWAQLFLLEDCQQPQLVASSFSATVETGGFIGSMVAGILTDIFLRRAEKRKGPTRGNARLPAALIFTILSCGTLHLMCFTVHNHTSGLWINLIALFLGASLYGPIAIYGVVATESAPDHLSGTAHAIVALAANVGAIASGLPFSYLAKYHSWWGIFVLLEGLSVLTVFVILIGRNVSSQISNTPGPPSRRTTKPKRA